MIFSTKTCLKIYKSFSLPLPFHLTRGRVLFIMKVIGTKYEARRVISWQL